MMFIFMDGVYMCFLFDFKNVCDNIYDGYFFVDKKGVSVELKSKEGENEECGFNLIMKDKECLLS